LVVAEWPKQLNALVDTDIERQIEIIQSPVRAFRDMKNKYNIPNSEMVSASASVPTEILPSLKSKCRPNLQNGRS
jgi:valyl-tRNA synthetase